MTIFKEFFNKCTFEKLLIGTSNWDLYLMQYEDNEPSVVSIAKDEKRLIGCQDASFGSIKYFKEYLNRNPKECSNLTTKGLEIVNSR